MTAWTGNIWRRSGNTVSGGTSGDDSPASGSLSRTLTDADVFYAGGAAGAAGPDGFGSQSTVVPGGGFIVNGATGGAGAGSAGSTGSTNSAAVIGSAGTASPFVISVTYDQATSSLPAGFVAAVNYVVSYYESVFTTSTTVNIDLGYGDIDGQPLGAGQPGILGESETYIDPDDYSQVVSALQANATSPAQQAAYATLPASSPLSNGTLWVATAEEKALGLIPQDNYIDGYVGINNSFQWSYSAGVTPPAGEFYLIGVLEHEFSEVMGRDSFLGDSIGGTTNDYSPMDLFRYSAPGVRDLTATPPVANTAYFSINSGSSNLQSWNTSASGDLGDWANSAKNDAYLAFSNSATINSVTQVDLELMNILGYQLSGSVSSSGALIVSGGATDYITSGQASSGTQVLSGGLLVVLSGGTASGTVISGGGSANDYGSASGTLIAGIDRIESGGVESGAVLSNGGTEFIQAHGVANALTVSSGGVVADSGSASGTVVRGLDYLESGSVETGATLSSGGTEFIYPGGTALGLTILNGGVAANSGGSAAATIVDNGGLDFLQSGGVETGATLSGGTAFITSGGTALGLTVSSGGVAANYGGSASGTIVRNGGLDYVEPGAVETGGVLSSGGIEFIEAGGTTLGLTVSGGGIAANYGGSASGTIVRSGGQDYLESGTVETGATLGSGGIAFIEAGGTAAGLVVSGGIAANDGGSASGTIVRNGGQDYLESGAVETGATLLSGGVEYISAGGLARALAVGAGATVADYGGSASGTIVSSGGQDYLESGAVESSATIDRFGAEFIESGGTAIGITVSGLVDLTSGGVISGTVNFGSRGQLQLADSQNFHNLVAGFSGTTVKLDLQDIAYVSGATTVNWTQLTSGANASGTLTVSEGGHVANINLIGQYATGNFVISGDGAAGTMVVDPPIASANETAALTTPAQH